MINKEQLEQKISEGEVLKSWCQHPGYKIWKRELDAKINDLKNEWLKADDETGKKIKLRAQVYMEVLDVIKKKILEGEHALTMLQNLGSEESEQPK